MLQVANSHGFFFEVGIIKFCVNKTFKKKKKKKNQIISVQYLTLAAQSPATPLYKRILSELCGANYVKDRKKINHIFLK